MSASRVQIWLNGGAAHAAVFEIMLDPRAIMRYRNDPQVAPLLNQMITIMQRQQQQQQQVQQERDDDQMRDATGAQSAERGNAPHRDRASDGDSSRQSGPSGDRLAAGVLQQDPRMPPPAEGAHSPPQSVHGPAQALSIPPMRVLPTLRGQQPQQPQAPSAPAPQPRREFDI